MLERLREPWPDQRAERTLGALASLVLLVIVLMIVFVVTVYDTLAMPQFDASLLGLMGISSAAYAGMKIPEQKQ